MSPVETRPDGDRSDGRHDPEATTASLAAPAIGAKGGGQTAVAEADGSLERKSGQLNKNIAGGVPRGYHGHHLIAVHLASGSPVMQRAAELGYDIDRASNGMALPSTVSESQRTGLALHTGAHLKTYFAFIDDELTKIERKMSRLSDRQLLVAVERLEDRLRAGLSAGGDLRLQNEDPRSAG